MPFHMNSSFAGTALQRDIKTGRLIQIRIERFFFSFFFLNFYYFRPSASFFTLLVKLDRVTASSPSSFKLMIKLPPVHGPGNAK